MKHRSKNYSFKKFAASCVILSVFVMTGTVFAAGVSLPYSDGFESGSIGPLSTAGGTWSISDGGANVTNSPVLTGSKSCNLTNGSEAVRLTLNVDTTAGDYTNVWVQYFAKLYAYDESSGYPAVSNETCAFFVNTGGVVHAYTTNAAGDNIWTNLVSVNTNQWMGFALHLDYSNQVWDLYVSDSGTRGGTMTKANTDWPLGFNTNSANLEVEEIIVEGQADLDSIGATFSFDVVDGSTKSYVATLDTLAGNNLAAAPVHHYNTAADEDRLDGQFGADLGSGLRNTDVARFYWTNGWNSYTYDGSGGWSSDEGFAVADFHCKGKSMWLERGSTPGLSVFPFDSEDASVKIGISGTSDSSVAPGWTLVAWPFTGARAINNGDNNFASIVEDYGDRIYLYKNGKYVRLWWDEANGIWKEGRNSSSRDMEGGEAFWWYHEGASNTWTVTKP